MTAEHDHDRLWQEALGLMLRLREHPADRGVSEEIRHWRGRSAAHEAAWSEAEQVWRLSGQVRAKAAPKAAPTPPRMLTRRRLVGGLSAAAAAGVLGIAGSRLLGSPSADYVTDAGEIRSFTLPDASLATLGPRSALDLAFSAEGRSIDLVDGMVYVDVSHKATRSFVANCGALAVTADAASFDISRDGSVLTVAADRGQVSASVPRGTGRAEISLDAGDWLRFDESDRSTASGRLESEYRAAWRQGLVVAEREPIDAVVSKVARWYAGKVVVAPGFGRRRISGIFDLRDPVAALEAIVAPFDGRVHRLTPWLVIVAAV